MATNKKLWIKASEVMEVLEEYKKQIAWNWQRAREKDDYEGMAISSYEATIVGEVQRTICSKCTWEEK